MRKQTYRYMEISKAGGPEVLELRESELPEPKADEVRIRVEAAGVAYPDMMIRIQTQAAYPITPGYDAVGIVDKLGEEVDEFKIGQRVIRVNEEGTGGYSEMICHRANELIVVPEGVEPAEAVAVGLNGVMAYQMVHRVAHLARGEKVLVHVAAGGIGHLLIQLSLLAGATVYGCASTKKQYLVASMGAIPIDYRLEDFETRIKELTGDGVHVIFDSIGGPNLEKSFRSLRINGRMVIYGSVGAIMNGVRNEEFAARHREVSVPWSARDFIANSKSVCGYAFYNVKKDTPDTVRSDLATILGLVADQRIKPIIGMHVPLIEARRAHEMIDAASFAGKMVLDVV